MSLSYLHTAEPESRRQGILRISNEILAVLLGLPKDARIVGVSGEAYWLTNETGIQVEHESLPLVQPGCYLGEIPPTVTFGEVVAKIDWSQWMPGTEPEIRPDAKKLAALLREASNFLAWRTADGLDLALRLQRAAAELEGQDGPSLKEANEQHARADSPPFLMPARLRVLFNGNPVLLDETLSECGPWESTASEVTILRRRGKFALQSIPADFLGASLAGQRVRVEHLEDGEAFVALICRMTGRVCEFVSSGAPRPTGDSDVAALEEAADNPHTVHWREFLG